jgi:elongation factor Ts
MAEITAGLVKDLREKTGAGMMDCKKALTETGGDMEGAVDWLRKKGLAAAAKKAGRVAAEGLIGVATGGVEGAMVEVNAETDFVARNDQFQEFVSALSQVALASDGTLDGLKAMPYPQTDRTVEEETVQKIATIGENITVRRVAKLTVESGLVASYIHNAAGPGLGKIGVLVGLQSTADPARLEVLGRQLAMHIAAARPEAVDVASLDPALIDRERNVLTEQARASGKPDSIIEKMVEGRLRKYYEEAVLLEQIWVIDNESRVGKVIEAAAKDLGAPITVTGFVRFNLGEGIEKKESDLAGEVAATLTT